MSTQCPTCGLMRGMTDARRVQVLEDTVFYLESGLTEAEAMFRTGYTARPSWLRTLHRAGLPTASPEWNGHNRAGRPNILTRLREAGLA